MPRRRRLANRRKRRLLPETLETRLMLDASGLLWADSPYLTMSFAPDGTDVAGQPSELFQLMDAVASTDEWQDQIKRAFQTWASLTNADMGIVPDGGRAFGSDGPTKNSPHFGDIRIGAAPLPPDVLAVSIAQNEFMAGTWVGDVLFNSQGDFQSVEDIFSVALHEAGHVFGLPHSEDPASPMFFHGVSPQVTPTAGDVANLQDLYGQRIPDSNESHGNFTDNDSFATATQLKLFEISGDDKGAAPSIVYGDIGDLQDEDYFILPALSDYTGPVTFQLRSAGISLLAPRLSVYDQNFEMLGEVSSNSQAGGVATVSFNQIGGENQYYLHVAGAVENEYGTGGYSLVLRYDDAVAIDDERVDALANGQFRFLTHEQLAKMLNENESEFINDDKHEDDEFELGVELKTSPGFRERTRYDVLGSISDAADIDFYRVESPDSNSSPLDVMTVRIASLEGGRLIPQVSVFDEDENLVPAAVLSNGSGEYVLQVVGVTSGQELILSVGGATNSWPFDTGNYRLTTSFGDNPAELQTFAAGTLDAGQSQQAHSLYVGRTQLFHFGISSEAAAGASSVALIASFLNAEQETLFRLAARPGETRTINSTFLAPGSYTVQVTAVSLDGGPLPAIDYSITGDSISDPLGATPDDPTGSPSFDCPDNSGLFCYPGEVVSTNPFLWDDFLNSLPDAPTLDPAELISLLLGDWWSWYWNRDPGNGPPLAMSDEFSTEVGQMLEVSASAGLLGNDVDPEAGPLTTILEQTTQHGTLRLNLDGSFLYAPETGYTGVDTFSYRAYDFAETSAPATVTIRVEAALAPLTINGVALNQDQIDPPDLPTGPSPSSWAQQRSDLRGIRLSFSDNVLLGPQDLVLTNLGVDAPATPDQIVPLSAQHVVVEGNTVTLNFAAGELADGVYQLQVLASATDPSGNALDGDGDGQRGDSFLMVGDASNGLYQLTGDWNGDLGVSIFDFAALAYWFGHHLGEAPDYMDLNRDQGVSIFDFGAFASNFSSGVVFPQALLPTSSPEPLPAQESPVAAAPVVAESGRQVEFPAARRRPVRLPAVSGARPLARPHLAIDLALLQVLEELPRSRRLPR